MATVSTIPAVKAALVQLLSAALPTVKVYWGEPGVSQTREWCVVGDVSVDSTVPVMKAGRKTREERYTVDVTIIVILPRGTVRQADERAFTLLSAVEDVLADDPSLGGVDGLVYAALRSVDEVSATSDEGPRAAIRASVECVARLG